MEPKEIKALRKRLGLTQTQMADKIGVTKTSVLNWENGIAKPSKLARRELERLEAAS